MTSYKTIQAAEDGTARALERVVVLDALEDLVRSWYVQGKLGPDMYRRLMDDIYATRREYAELRDDLARLRRGE